MVDQTHFEEIYFNTYHKVLKYIVLHCSNIDDVNDIIQDTYIELNSLLNKERVMNRKDLSPFIIGIAKNKMKDFYRRKNKFKSVSLYDDEDLDLTEVIAGDIDIEAIVINSDKLDEVWKFIKSKNEIVGKIFYLYYYLGLPIKNIARDLDTKESTIKNHLYRTLKEMHERFNKEMDKDD